MTDQNTYFLHIGYPKTATSWLQHNLFPKIKGITLFKHGGLPAYLFEGQGNDSILKCRQFFGHFEGKIVISDESLIGNTRKGSFYWYPVKFRQIFDDVHVIIFLRNQIDKYASNYNQYIKGAGGTCRIDDFLFPNGSTMLWGFEKHCYDRLLNAYKESFPEEKIHVYLYEEFHADPKSFVEGFIKKFNLKVNLSDIDFDPRNRSLAVPLIHIKRRLNYFTRECQKITHPSLVDKRYILNIPYWLDTSKAIFKTLNNLVPTGKRNTTESILGTNNIQKLSDCFAQSNRNLVEQHDLERISRYKYPL